MGKIKKFASINIRKITGGKDPINLVEEFILRLGFDPDQCIKETTPDNVRWMVSFEGDEELEVLVEGIKRPQETTIYMGVNIATVPVRGANDMLVAALELADGLVGTKVSLVGHYLVLSSSLGVDGAAVEDLDYAYRLILAQKDWFKNTLADELGLAELPEG